MDIIKNIIHLSGENIIIYFEKIITESNSELDKIINTNIHYKLKIKALIDNTYLFDTYMGCINLMNIITKENKIFWERAEKIIHDYNIKFNTNKKLLELIIKLINETDDKYEKIFLSKMSKSMEKYGIVCENQEHITKLLLQLEQTENNISSIIDKSIKLKVDKNKIDARSESIMTSIFSDKNDSILINKKTFYYLMKKIRDKNIRNNLEEQYNKKHIELLPLVGKLIALRHVYAKSLHYENYYDLCSKKTAEETEELQKMITDLNDKLDSSFGKIIYELKDILKKDKISFNDIIYAIDLIKPDIKFKPREILQYVMVTIQKKFNIGFESSRQNSLNQYSNCIEIYDNNKNLRGYLHMDLMKRETKNINQTTVIKLNNQYGDILPSMYLMCCYDDLEKEVCTYSELVNMFREFGNILINIFAYTPNGINEIDIEIYTFMPEIMEFLAYDDFVLDMIYNRMYKDNINKKKRELKLLRRLEMIINLKIKCANALFDNVVHSKSNIIDLLRKSDSNDIKNILIDLNHKIMNDIFKKHCDIIDIKKNYVFPSFINNLINGNQGYIYGTILSIILAYNAYKLIILNTPNNFINKLLENKEYSYRKMILEFISELNHDYYDEFITKCLNIEIKKINSYDENTQTENL